MKNILFVFFISLPFGSFAQKADSLLVSKTISYESALAGSAQIVWAVNQWQKPDSTLWPPDTYLKDKLAYTSLKRNGDVFSVNFSLPHGTRLDYYFVVTTNRKGEAIYAWDTNNEALFSTAFTDANPVAVKDDKLKVKSFGFDVFNIASKVLLASLILAAVLFFWRRPRLTKPVIFGGLAISCLIIMLLARFQMSALSFRPGHIGGIIFSDLLWVSAIAVLFYAGFYFTRKYRVLQNLVFYLTSALIVFSAVIALLNIDVVRQLGAPFNYKLLYYSDFLRGEDAKNGIREVLTHDYLKKFAFLLAAFVLIAFIFSALLAEVLQRRRMGWLYLMIPAALIGFSYYAALKNTQRVRNAMRSPIPAFFTSLVNPNGDGFILQQDVPDAIEKEYNSLHHPVLYQLTDSFSYIKNIIVFVSESTPQNLVNVYNQRFNAMPLLEKRMAQALRFDQVYANIPSTPNSLFSILYGAYPRVDFNNMPSVNNAGNITGLPAQLKKNGWESALFFASDIYYNGMSDYAKNSGLSVIQDIKNIDCGKRYTANNKVNNSVSDSCLLPAFFNWFDQSTGNKRFSLMWTNQTHYPYFKDGEKMFAPDNMTLNDFLNALQHTDKVFEHLMLGLEKRGQLDSTLVIFTSDHGEAFGTHNQRLHASNVYQENVLIPCIFFQPRLYNQAAVNKTVFSLIDLAPTITQLAGVSPSKDWVGKSMLMDHNNSRSFFSSPYYDLILGTASDGWKYIYNATSREDELYNLKTDPNELENFASKHPQKTTKERQLVTAWVQAQKKRFSTK